MDDSVSGPRGYLRLFVSRGGTRSEASLQAVRAACLALDRHRFDLEVLYLPEGDAVARRDGILLTPTLVRAAPGPERRWIGDLTDPDRVQDLLRLGELGDE